MTCGAGLCLTAVTPRPRRMGGCTARRTGASVRCMATTTADLAAHLSVDEGGVDVLLELLDEPPGVLADDLAEFLREVFDPHGELDPAGRAVLARRRPAAAPGVRARAGRTRRRCD